jgi:YwiC-like protein
MAAHISTVQNSRLKTMVVPREHGAWGMLLVPLATGAAVAAKTGTNFATLVLFTVAAMSLFWLRTPVESWLGTAAIKARSDAERSYVLRTIVAVAALALVSIAALLWHGRNLGLMAIGAIAALAFAAQALVKKLGRKGRMPAQVIGAIGLTSSAAGAYYVVTGRLDRTAVALWLANWLFAGNQIHFVQVRIRSARAASFNERLAAGLPFLLAQIAMLAAILIACRFGFFRAAVAMAFLPVLLRGTVWFGRAYQPLDVHKLGFTELAHALVFGALLCGTFLI